MIYPIYKPIIGEKEKEYVNECLDSTWISSRGKFIEKFEENIKHVTESNYCTSVCNGTTALHLALMCLGIKNGDKVIAPDFTYVATVNPIKYVGAEPILVDVRGDDWNISYEEVVKNYEKDVKAIILVDIYGAPPKDLDKILEFAKDKGVFVIEDSAESLGGSYNSKPCGSLADVGIFSFFGNKTITTGEGGALVTNNDKINYLSKKIRDQGNSEYQKYHHDILGHNFRMTNIQAAIGCAQIEKLEPILSDKQNILNWYKKHLNNNVVFQVLGDNIKSSNWMVSFLIEKDRDSAINKLKKFQIETRPFFPPVSTMPFYKNCSNIKSQYISKKGISVPSYPQLKESDVKKICESINLILSS